MNQPRLPSYWPSRGLSEEDRELGRSSGVEQAALFRRTLTTIPHADYRTLVVREVYRTTKHPTAADWAKAKQKVEATLIDQNLAVAIPQAKPVRVTR